MSWAALPPTAAASQPASYAYPMNTAYTAVPVRQTFGQTYQNPSQYTYSASSPTNATLPPAPVMPAAPEQQAPSQQKVDWPDSVRRYVQRSFQESNIDSTVARADMEARLKQTIRYTQDTGTMHSTNWDLMPLPQQMIKTERQQAILATMNIPPGYEQATAAALQAVSSTKKRASSDLSSELGHNNGSMTSPWKPNANKMGASLQDRISRPTNDSAASAKSKFQKTTDKRQRRGDGGYVSSYRSPSPEPTAGPIVGLNTTLEKRYLRLTSAPKPADVRPEHILRQTLDLLKKKWRKEGNYAYICDQFKSLRQDLTVQRIRNEFTVSVYEIHARIALEKGDLGEYNQCQTQLRVLYASGIKGSNIEFKAYRILYFLHTANRSALNDAMLELTSAEKEERAIKHALNVRSALALGNHHKFFQLYLDVPNMGAYLIDMFVKRERLAALTSMCRAFKPDVKLRYVTEELAFESDAEAAQFIIDCNGQHLLEEKADHIAFLTGKAGQLFEQARAVAFSRVDLKGQI